VSRTFTPDRVVTQADGRTITTITTKRVCNGCGEFVGDVTDAEMDCAIDGRPLPDVRSECEHCAPVVALEQADCQTWQVTPQNIARVANQIDRLRPWFYTKGYWRSVGPEGQLDVVGLRVGEGEGRVVAFWGDWLIRHPDGHYTVHTAPKPAEPGDGV
jgi:hypothetical protein